MQDFKKYWWIIAVVLILIFAIGAKMWSDQRAKDRQTTAVLQEADLVILELSAKNMETQKEMGYKITPQDMKEADSLINELERLELRPSQRRRLEMATATIDKIKETK